MNLASLFQRPPTLRPARLRPLLDGWRVQRRTLAALIVRDMMMRYGREHLGFVWVVLEPMLLTAGVLVLWSQMKGGFEHGVRLVELVLTGYMLLTLWRHLTSATIQLFRRNAFLLYHRPITALDFFFARVVLEFAATTAALLIVVVPLVLLGIVNPVGDLSIAIAGWLMMFAMGTGAGALILAATEKNETLEKFIQPMQYLMVPLSGTFFMVSWFPERIQDLLLVNPLIHCYEMLRAGFWGPAVETRYSIPYALAWAVGLNLLGVWGMSRVRRDIQIA